MHSYINSANISEEANILNEGLLGGPGITFQDQELINENKIKEATVSFEIISLSKFSLSNIDYISLFYYIVEYKIGKSNNISIDKLKEIESKYVNIVNRTGFKRFTSKFLKEY